MVAGAESQLIDRELERVRTRAAYARANDFHDLDLPERPGPSRPRTARPERN